MKKLFMLTTTLLFFIYSYAQENSVAITGSQRKMFHPIRYGFDAGGSIARIKGNGFDDSRQVGYFFGAFVRAYISKAVTLQGGIDFSRSGAKTSNNFNDLYTTADAKNNGREIHLDYVQIPILVNIPFGYTGFHLQLGPQFSKYVGGKALFQTSTKTFNDSEVAALVGVWYERCAFNIHARYLLGLSNINADQASNTWQTRTLQFGVGLTL